MYFVYMISSVNRKSCVFSYYVLDNYDVYNITGLKVKPLRETSWLELIHNCGKSRVSAFISKNEK